MRGCLPPYRRLHRTQKFANSSKASSDSFDLDATDKALAEPLLCETLPFNAQSEMLKTVLAKRDGGSSSVGEVLKADFVSWAQLGSLRGHQEQQWSKTTAKTAVVNCTMLPYSEDPISRWTAHYDQQFMRGWAPLELHELQAVARPDQLASALQAAATAARASPAVEEAPLPGPWGAFPSCPAPPVGKAGARPEYRPALLNQTYKAGTLARACMVRMAAACMAMQRNARLGGPGEVVPVQLPPAGHSRPGDSAGRSGVPAQLCFWLGDCLQLCQGPDLEQHWAHRPAAQPTVVRAPQQAQQGQPLQQPAVQQPLMFHVIDTSNVADHAGLLNLLLATQPRLVPHPLARLITCSMTWTMSFKSMREYLQSCLSCPPSMYPTLLGLRLVTDITAGRPQPLGMAAQLSAIRQDPRPLVWSKPVAAVGTAALTQTLMQSQQQLMAAGWLQCKDPQSGPGLVGEPSRAMTQEVPAVKVLSSIPGLALTGAKGVVPPRRTTGGEGAKVAAGLKDSLEHHLEVLTRRCTPQ
ncbi:MYND-type domain-containing protein, partial [Haematococcus lacustris]